MFSFSTITVFATVALSGFASAIPLSRVSTRQLPNLPVVGDVVNTVTGTVEGLPVVGGVVGNVAGAVRREVPVVGGVLDTVTGTVEGLPVVGDVAKTATGLVRRDNVQSIAVIFTDATNQIKPFADQLKFATKQNATVEALTEPVNNIKNVLTNAISLVQGLAGQPIEVILATVDGTGKIAVDELAAIVATLLITVFAALGAVLTLLGGLIAPAVFVLLAEVGALVGTLLAAVLTLVGAVLVDLVAVLLPLIGEVIPFILTLNVATLIKLLGL